MKGLRRSPEYAGFGVRLLSWLIDMAVLLGLSVAALLIGVVVMMIAASAETRGDMGAWFLLFYGIALLCNAISCLYYIIFWSRDGQTLGKRATGLKVVRSDGRPLGAGRAILRLIGYYVCVGTFLIGFILAAFDQEKRGLHDFIADTRVIMA